MLYVKCYMLHVKLYIVYAIYQASFYHEKVGVKLFLLTKMLIFIVFNMLGVFLKKIMKYIAKTLSLRPLWAP